MLQRILPGAIVVLAASTAMAYEEPRYQVIESYEDWELRRYDPYLVAEVEVDADFEDAGNRAFRTLAGYIFGDNVRREEIGMTIPVSQRPAGEEIGMTAPVTQSKRGDRYAIAFVMPGRYTLETLPRPSDSRIQIREVPERWVAARRYSGTWSEDGYREHEAKLFAGMATAELWPASPPIWARYNSPFSIWFLRRNEVLVEVSPASPGLGGTGALLRTGS